MPKKTANLEVMVRAALSSSLSFMIRTAQSWLLFLVSYRTKMTKTSESDSRKCKYNCSASNTVWILEKSNFLQVDFSSFIILRLIGIFRWNIAPRPLCVRLTEFTGRETFARHVRNNQNENSFWRKTTSMRSLNRIIRKKLEGEGGGVTGEVRVSTGQSSLLSRCVQK